MRGGSDQGQGRRTVAQALFLFCTLVTVVYTDRCCVDWSLSVAGSSVRQEWGQLEADKGCALCMLHRLLGLLATVLCTCHWS